MHDQRPYGPIIPEGVAPTLPGYRSVERGVLELVEGLVRVARHDATAIADALTTEGVSGAFFGNAESIGPAFASTLWSAVRDWKIGPVAESFSGRPGVLLDDYLEGVFASEAAGKKSLDRETIQQIKRYLGATAANLSTITGSEEIGLDLEVVKGTRGAFHWDIVPSLGSVHPIRAFITLAANPELPEQTTVAVSQSDVDPYLLMLMHQTVELLKSAGLFDPPSSERELSPVALPAVNALWKLVEYLEVLEVRHLGGQESFNQDVFERGSAGHLEMLERYDDKLGVLCLLNAEEQREIAADLFHKLNVTDGYLQRGYQETHVPLGSALYYWCAKGEEDGISLGEHFPLIHRFPGRKFGGESDIRLRAAFYPKGGFIQSPRDLPKE